MHSRPGGNGRFYVQAPRRRGLSIPFPENGWPLEMRVGRHPAGVVELLGSCGELWPEENPVFAGVADYPTVLDQSIGCFLR